MNHIPQEEVLATSHRKLGSYTLQTQLIRDETYTWTPADGSPELHIRSGALTRWLHEHAKQKIIELTFPEDTLEGIIARHGVDVQRALRLTDEAAAVPVVVAMLETEYAGTHLLLDGAHRRYYWAERKVNVLRGWAVPEVIWRQFIFDPATEAVAVEDRK